MKIQEFACEQEVEHATCTEETRQLLEQLGAEGQKTYYETSTNEVCPYRKMTKVEYAVYKTALPVRQKIKAYDAGPIPLRVLQIGAHATGLLEKGELVVWHAGVGKDDPLLTLQVGSEWSGEYYLLARWATELEEFGVLYERAVQAIVADTLANLHKGKAELEEWVKNCEVYVRKRLQEGKTDSPSVHWF